LVYVDGKEPQLKLHLDVHWFAFLATLAKPTLTTCWLGFDLHQYLIKFRLLDLHILSQLAREIHWN
jgi:hypothetical protein